MHFFRLVSFSFSLSPSPVHTLYSFAALFAHCRSNSLSSFRLFFFFFCSVSHEKVCTIFAVCRFDLRWFCYVLFCLCIYVAFIHRSNSILAYVCADFIFLYVVLFFVLGCSFFPVFCFGFFFYSNVVNIRSISDRHLSASWIHSQRYHLNGLYRERAWRSQSLVGNTTQRGPKRKKKDVKSKVLLVKCVKIGWLSCVCVCACGINARVYHTSVHQIIQTKANSKSAMGHTSTSQKTHTQGR